MSNLLITDMSLKIDMSLDLSLGATSSREVHDGHYICLGGEHYKTSDGMYYKCSSN